MESKRCGKCGETKPREAFYRHRDAKDGLTSQCKGCHKATKAAWQKVHRKPGWFRAA